tara:strand:- start:113 stop:1546 length:1434 start_codon:yes stop_codon:yes gene_type:complete
MYKTKIMFEDGTYMTFTSKLDIGCLKSGHYYHGIHNILGSKIFKSSEYYIDIVDIENDVVVYLAKEAPTINHLEHTGKDTDGEWTQNWYNVQLDDTEWRTVAITVPTSVPVKKYLINFDFTTGYNTGTDGMFPLYTGLLKKMPHYGFLHQNIQKTGSKTNSLSAGPNAAVGGLEILNSAAGKNPNSTVNPWILPAKNVFLPLVNQGVAIVHLTMSTYDGVAFMQDPSGGSCSDPCSPPEASDYDRTQCTTCSPGCTKMDKAKNGYCMPTQASMRWNNSYDKIYIGHVMSGLQNNKFTKITSDIGKNNLLGVFGWSVGGTAVSRYMNEYTANTWPAPEYGIIGSGGSLHCYEGKDMDKWKNNNEGTTTRSTPSKGYCPYYSTGGEITKLVLEPYWDTLKTKYEGHPPVIGFQSSNDKNADPTAVDSYINTLLYYKIGSEKNRIKHGNYGAHGMSTPAQAQAILDILSKSIEEDITINY